MLFQCSVFKPTVILASARPSHQKLLFLPYFFFNLISQNPVLIESSSLEQIKTTENWLEFDQKIFTMTNLIFWTWPKFMTPTNINMTPTNINFTPKKIYWCCRLGQVPWLALAGTPAQPHFTLLQEIKHQARRLGGPRT